MDEGIDRWKDGWVCGYRETPYRVRCKDGGTVAWINGWK